MFRYTCRFAQCILCKEKTLLCERLFPGVFLVVYCCLVFFLILIDQRDCTVFLAYQCVIVKTFDLSRFNKKDEYWVGMIL